MSSEQSPPAYAEIPSSKLRYQLRQDSHKVQTIVPIVSNSSTSYTVKKKSSVFAMSSEPDMVFTRKSSEMKTEEAAGSTKMAKTGTFPWVPRATISYAGDAVSLASTDEMTMKQFRNLQWTFSINGRPHHWSILPNPSRFVLVDQQTGVIEAAFIYSAVGSSARGGAEVGEFEIARLGLELDPHYLEQLFFSAVVVISYARDAGRVLINRTKRSAVGTPFLEGPVAPAYWEERVMAGFAYREHSPRLPT